MPDTTDGRVATCDVTKAFDSPVLVAGSDAVVAESSPHLSPDELTLYFEGAGGSLPGGNSIVLYQATRGEITDAFGPPTRLSVSPPTPNTYYYGPSVSSDGRTLLYTVQTVPPLTPTQLLWVATRGSTLQDFSAPAPLSSGITEGAATFPFLTADGAELWYGADPNPSQGLYHLYAASKAGSGFADPIAQTTLSSAASEWKPVLSFDRLSIYFASNRTAGEDFDIWMSRRASTAYPFQTPQPVRELNSPQVDEPGWLSSDNCRLYMSSARGGHAQMFVATRAP